MFYLIEFLRFLKQRPILAGVQVGLFFLISFGGSIEKKIAKNVFPKRVEQKELKHFYGLVSSRHNIQRIARKLRSLPGIEEVQVFREDHIKEKVSAVLKSIKTELIKSAPTLEQSGLKISFAHGTSDRSVTLVKDYIGRLVGKNEVLLGPTKEPTNKKIRVNKASFLQANFSLLYYGVLIVLWALATLSLLGPLKQKAYLISKFQRKENVSLKMVLSFYIPFIMFAIVFGFAFNQLGKFDFAAIGVLCILIVIPFVGRDKWKAV